MIQVLLGKLYCFIGLHHDHELSDTGIVKRLPRGVSVTGTYCCRCMRVHIVSVKVDKEVKDEPET